MGIRMLKHCVSRTARVGFSKAVNVVVILEVYF